MLRNPSSAEPASSCCPDRGAPRNRLDERRHVYWGRENRDEKSSNPVDGDTQKEILRFSHFSLAASEQVGLYLSYTEWRAGVGLSPADELG